MENLVIVATQVAILFALMGCGAVARWTKLVDSAAVKGMVNLLILIVTPSLIIHVFQRPFDSSMLKQFALAFIIAAAAHVTLILIARYICRGSDKALPVLKVATVFSNAGFMGIPLEYAILGETGVFYGIVYVAMFNLFMWSWGLAVMKGAKLSGSWQELRPMIINPGTVGIAIGLPLFLFSIALPEITAKPVKMLADLNTPLAMVVIGFYLAGADLKKVAKFFPAYITTFVRLIVSPLALLAALYPFRNVLDRTMMLALITAASAPVGAMVSMFASKYERDVDLSVGLVSGTTLLSILTMPVIIALAMNVL